MIFFYQCQTFTPDLYAYKYFIIKNIAANQPCTRFLPPKR